MFNGVSYNATDPKHVTVSMTGLAQSVNSVAFQSEVLANGNVIRNPIFSGISRQADGVHFSVVADIDPVSIGYSQIVLGDTAQQQDQQPAPSATQETTKSPFGTPGVNQ